MSDFEKKIFKINQTEKLLSSLSEGWKSYYNSFDELRNEMRKAIWRERNPILAVCGFVASVLLGLISTNNITMSEFQTYLAIDGVVAFLVFAGYGIYNLMVLKSTIDPEQSFIHIIANLDGLKNHFLALTYEIDEIGLSKLDDLFVFAILSEGSNKIRMYKELEKFSKLKRISREVSNEIKRSISIWLDGINESIKSFEKIKDEFEKEEWKKYKPYIQDLIDYTKTEKTKFQKS